MSQTRALPSLGRLESAGPLAGRSEVQKDLESQTKVGPGTRPRETEDRGLWLSPGNQLRVSLTSSQKQLSHQRGTEDGTEGGRSGRSRTSDRPRRPAQLSPGPRAPRGLWSPSGSVPFPRRHAQGDRAGGPGCGAWGGCGVWPADSMGGRRWDTSEWCHVRLRTPSWGHI